MKPIEFITLFVITGMVLFIIGWIVAEWGKKCLAQANKYEKYHDSIKLSIDELVVNKSNYDKLMIRFKRLGNMKWKDRNRTTDLFVEFMQRFKSEATKTIDEL